ncbi:hypothetical protein ZWY2020_034924 [Hordeum vulgare]|nr:hypothetical protein ZWY2020_034924 [Hordeum vulgare]
MNRQEHFTLERHDEQGYCCGRRLLIYVSDWSCVCAPSHPVHVLLSIATLANILMQHFLCRRNNLPRRLTRYNEMLTYHEQEYVSTEHLCCTLKCLHNMEVISHILKQLIYLPIYNADTNFSSPHSNCIPMIGELSDVLLHSFFQ